MHEIVIRGGTVVDGSGSAPFTGDVAIDGGMITEVGGSLAGRRVVDAAGAVVAPGWVDVHTHYDGQVAWDDTLDPSFSNGVTTMVMGNCGVGFAPCPPGREQALIELMEGVEDIPGTALYEGVPWGAWNSFPQYLDFLASRRYTMDVGAQVPHSALRFAVMGDRSLDDEATPADLAEMRRLVAEAVAAGALGLSTSRTVFHRSLDGLPVPGTYAPLAELLELARGMVDGGGGVFEVIPASSAGELRSLGGERFSQDEELGLLAAIARHTGVPVTFTTVQNVDHPDAWQEVLAFAAERQAEGLRLHPQVGSRPVSILASLDGYHPFMQRPSYLAVASLPRAERAAALRDPVVRARVLAETDQAPDAPGPMDNMARGMHRSTPHMFLVDEVVDYEPPPEHRVGALAAASGQTPHEVLYDHLTSGTGEGLAVLWGAGYAHGNLDAIGEMLADPHTVTGLADAGAHVRLICDGSAPTTQLSHWVRDRTRGGRLPIEMVVAKQTRRNAELYGLPDRGLLAPGLRADLNVIDLDGLSVRRPVVHCDLPAGGWRFLQPVSGYLATFVAGVQTRADDADTGQRPGRLVRRGA
ncbi:MAG: amidohydrolase family protein [Acidimicrobiales bacterium]